MVDAFSLRPVEIHKTVIPLASKSVLYLRGKFELNRIRSDRNSALQNRRGLHTYSMRYFQ